jgi:hypothetical protein
MIDHIAENDLGGESGFDAREDGTGKEIGEGVDDEAKSQHNWSEPRSSREHEVDVCIGNGTKERATMENVNSTGI